MNTRYLTSTVSTFFLLLILLNGGCINQQGLSVSYYTLSPSDTDISPQSSTLLQLEIRPVVLPYFLNQGQIISRDSPYSIQIEEQRRWAGELSEMISHVVKNSLTHITNASAPPQSSLFSQEEPLHISLSFTHFEKSADGSAHITVNWKILSKDATITGYSATSNYNIATDDSSFESLAKALSVGLEKLSQEIAKKLLTPYQP